MSRKRAYFSVEQSQHVVYNQSLNPKTEQKQTQFSPLFTPLSPSARQNKPTPGPSGQTSSLASRPWPFATGRRGVSALEAKGRSFETQASPPRLTPRAAAFNLWTEWISTRRSPGSEKKGAG